MPVVIAYHATACATAVYYAVNALEISVSIILFLIIIGSEFCGNTALLAGSSTDQFLVYSKLLRKTEYIFVFWKSYSIGNVYIFIGMSFAWYMKIQEQLKCSKNYLKTDYKIHIASESRCGDHCCNHALSSSEAEFRSRCKHKHNVECDQCQMLKTTLQEIDDASKSTADTKLRFVFCSSNTYFVEI